MSTSRLSRRLTALTLAGVAMLGLTACTGASTVSDGSRPTSSASEPKPSVDVQGDEGQSTADACALVEDTISQASAEFENISSEDPTALVEAMRSAAQQLSDASSQITNDQVAALVPSLQEMFSKVADVMQALAEGDASKLGEVEQLGTSFQETSAAFQELCAP